MSGLLDLDEFRKVQRENPVFFEAAEVAEEREFELDYRERITNLAAKKAGLEQEKRRIELEILRVSLIQNIVQTNYENHQVNKKSPRQPEAT